MDINIECLMLDTDVQHQIDRLILVMLQHQKHQHQPHEYQGQHHVVMQLWKVMQDVLERTETETETELGIGMGVEI